MREFADDEEGANTKASQLGTLPSMKLDAFEELLTNQLHSLHSTLLLRHRWELAASRATGPSPCARKSVVTSHACELIEPVHRSGCTGTLLVDDRAARTSPEKFDLADDPLPEHPDHWMRAISEESQAMSHRSRASRVMSHSSVESPRSPTSWTGSQRNYKKSWSFFVKALLQMYPEGERDVKTSNFMTMREPWTRHTNLTESELSTEDSATNVSKSAWVDGRRASLALQFEEAERHWCIIHPHSTGKLCWSLLSTLFILWDTITLPLQIFDHDVATDYFFDVAGLVTFFFRSLDLLGNFCTGVEWQGKLVMTPKRIASIYLRTYFIPDILILMIDVILFILRSSSALSSVRLLRVLRVVRFVRLLRLAKVRKVVATMGKYFTSVYAWLFGKMLYNLSIILVLHHYIALLFLLLGQVLRGVYAGSEGATTWLERMEIDTLPFYLQYVTALHWSLCQITPAPNDVRPVNPFERMFAIGVVLASMMMFSSFLGSMNGHFTTLRLIAEKEAQDDTSLRRFFTERRMPLELMLQLKEFRAQGTVTSRRSKLLEADVSVLTELPLTCRILVHKEMWQPVLATLRWLPPDFFSTDEALLLRVCHQAVIEAALKPADYMFLPGQTCQGPLVVTNGCMEYYEACQNVLVDEGDEVEVMTWLADIALWAEYSHRGALVAHESSNVACLRADIFAELAHVHGGATFQKLHMYGLLAVAHAEEDINLSDLGLSPTMAINLRKHAEELRGSLQSKKIKRQATTFVGARSPSNGARKPSKEK